MSRLISTCIEIEAPPEQVWGVLMDFPGHKEWDPLMTALTGQPVPGARLRVMVALPGRWRMVIRPQVMTCVPDREFSWQGGLPIPGLFDGRHVFRLEPAGEGKTLLVQEERFTGLLVWPLWALVGVPSGRGFAQFNQAIKGRVEQARPGKLPEATPKGLIHTHRHPSPRPRSTPCR